MMTKTPKVGNGCEARPRGLIDQPLGPQDPQAEAGAQGLAGPAGQGD
jgi:hypothetical protein